MEVKDVPGLTDLVTQYSVANMRAIEAAELAKSALEKIQEKCAHVTGAAKYRDGELVIKLDTPTNIRVDRSAWDQLRVSGELTPEAENCVRWSPDLRVGEFKKLEDEDSDLAKTITLKCLTERPGRMKLTVIATPQAVQG